MNTMPMVPAMLMGFGPRLVSTRSAISSEGNDIMASMTRITTSSVRPPLYPLLIPTTVPRTMPSNAPAAATEISDVAPDMTRLSTSRPNWSVPRRNWRDGPSS